MPKRPFRFLHAGDFHLERLPFGLAEVPEHLVSRLIDAPSRAARGVFDAALKEGVDFLVLSGGVLDATSGSPSALVFLAGQFERLREHGIPVYWAAGPNDPVSGWTDVVGLPANVHFFRRPEVVRTLHERDGEPLVRVLARNSGGEANFRALDFHCERSELFTIAIAHGAAAADALRNEPVDYWALGGEHARRSLEVSPNLAHYCGSPQGRSPQETGPHGCTLAQVDEEGRVRTSFVPTDVVRFQREQIFIGESSTRSDLERSLGERMASLRADETGPDLLVQWTIVGRGPLANHLRRGRLAAELLGRYRAELGQQRPAIWTVAIESVPTSAGISQTSVHADLYDQQTILGEFLRAVREHEAEPALALDLEPYLAERHLAGSLAESLRLDDPLTRTRVLREAAALGVDLLSPEEPLS